MLERDERVRGGSARRSIADCDTSRPVVRAPPPTILTSIRRCFPALTSITLCKPFVKRRCLSAWTSRRASLPISRRLRGLNHSTPFMIQRAPRSGILTSFEVDPLTEGRCLLEAFGSLRVAPQWRLSSMTRCYGPLCGATWGTSRVEWWLYSTGASRPILPTRSADDWSITSSTIITTTVDLISFTPASISQIPIVLRAPTWWWSGRTGRSRFECFSARRLQAKPTWGGNLELKTRSQLKAPRAPVSSRTHRAITARHRQPTATVWCSQSGLSIEDHWSEWGGVLKAP